MTISVTDTGVGIEEKEIPKLFDAFERLDIDDRRKLYTFLNLCAGSKILTDFVLILRQGRLFYPYAYIIALKNGAV